MDEWGDSVGEGRFPWEKYEHIQWFFSAEQKKRGDCLKEGFLPALPEIVNISLQQNDDLKKLVEIWGKMSDGRKARFEHLYGHIGDLLSVEVDEKLLKAAIYFWDVSYRCFVFNEVDMTPTVEEYRDMLQIGVAPDEKVFWPPRNSTWDSNLAKVLCEKVEKVRGYVELGGKRIAATHLIKFVEKHLQEDKGLNAFALLIYGLVLFPIELGYVNGVTIDLFEQVSHGADPSATIVAETMVSLHHCRKKGEGRFRGCAQLLSLWFRSHFGNVNDYPLCFRDHAKRPIQAYKDSKWPPKKTVNQWIEWFRVLTSEGWDWKAKFMDRQKTRYLNAEEPWLPLVGLTGATSYSHLLIRRQLGSKQYIPLTHGLSSIDFELKTAADKLMAKELVQKYKKAHFISAGGFTEKVDPEYPEWQKFRVKNLVLPPKRDPNYPVGPDGKDIVLTLAFEVKRLKEGSVMREMKAAKQKLIQEKTELGKENERYKNKVNAIEDQVVEEQKKVEALKENLRKIKEELDLEKKRHNDTFVLSESRNRDLKEKKRQLKSEIEIHQEVMNSLSQDYEQKLKKQKKEADDLEAKHLQQIAELTEQNVKLHLEKTEAVLKGNQLQERLKEVEREWKIIKESKKVNKDDLEKAHEDLVELGKKYDEIFRKYETLRKGNDSRCTFWKERCLEKLSDMEKLMIVVNMMIGQAELMEARANWLRPAVMPFDRCGRELAKFLEDAAEQYRQIIKFYNYGLICLEKN